MVLQSTSPSFLRAFFLVSLGTVALGQVITQAIALSTSITTNQNISLTFRSLADLNLFNATTKASLGMAISFVSLVIIFFLALSPRIPLPRTTFALLTCTKLLIQFGLSFQLPSFSLLLIRKMLDLFAFFTLSLEAVFT